MADYGRRGELLAITLDDLDPTAAEFLRTSDEESLLAVIRAQTGKARVDDAAGAGRQAEARKRPSPARSPSQAKRKRKR